MLKETASGNELWMANNADVADMSELALNMVTATADLNIASVHMMSGTVGFALTADGTAYFTNDGFATVTEQTGLGTVTTVTISEDSGSKTPLLLNSAGKLYK